MNSRLHHVVGIDLGTTFSAVATYDTFNEQAKILSNKYESAAAIHPEVTPSVISLHPGLRKAIVGWSAKRNLAYDPQNTIIEIKREMGEDFREKTEFEPSTLDKFGARGTFNVGDPVKAYFMGQWFLPQEISALVLMKMKEIAESEIGDEIHDAVITVPAYFMEKQRKATREAALLAGLYPHQIIPEPTAAAICYGVDKMESEAKVYLVYDLGGGTFDVSIIQVKETNINVIATSGDPRLGGGNFDDAITEWAVEELLQKYQIDVRADYAIKARIKALAEQAKIMVSTHRSTVLNLAEIFPQQSPTFEFTREKFEALIEHLLQKSITYLDKGIKLAEEKGVRREAIDAILLVGGSSKIPVVKQRLLDYFGKDESFVKSDLNPDEVVARGAAIIAKRFAPSPAPFDIRKKVESTLASTEEGDDLNIQFISEHSLGIEVQDKIFSKIVGQGTNIPIEVKQGGYTNQGPTNDIEVRIYQGENKYVYENTLIGTMHLGPMEPKPAKTHEFEVTFKLDVNNLLSVMVFHINEGKTYQARFEHKTGVGGEDALNVLYNKLQNLYANWAVLDSVSSQAVGTTTKTQDIAPPTPSTGQTVPSTEKEYRPPTPPISPSQSVTKEQLQQPSPSSNIENDKATPPAQAGIIEPKKEIPDEFKSIVRRTQKKLIKIMNPTLLKALNEFITALNAGKRDEELEELGDRLADVYHDTPEGPSISEPIVPVPEQFKSIVRRAQKQLLQELQLDLLNVFNTFISALNAGKSGDELEELGDRLDDMYHKIRK